MERLSKEIWIFFFNMDMSPEYNRTVENLKLSFSHVEVSTSCIVIINWVLFVRKSPDAVQHLRDAVLLDVRSLMIPCP